MKPSIFNQAQEAEVAKKIFYRENMNDLLALLQREIDKPIRSLILFVLISGLTNALLIGLINSASEYVANSEVNHIFFLLFILALGAFLLSKRYVLNASAEIVESVMYQVRVSLADKIRHTELSTLEAMGTSPIYARLTQDTVVISNTSTVMLNSIQSAIMIFFTTLYIGTISIGSFLFAVVGISLGVVYYRIYSSFFWKAWMIVSEKETAFFEKLGYILKGFKEIKINRRKNEGVFRNYKLVNKELKQHRLGTQMKYNGMQIFTQALFYFLLGGILFLLPHFHAEHSQDVIKVTAALLFIAGPFEGIMNSLQMFDNAGNSARNILQLEAQLEKQILENKLNIKAQNQPSSFKLLPYYENIQFQNLSYSYPPTTVQDFVFTVGPINLTIQKGELIFITGGNGSGKSTFLKLLTGLYPPETGQIIMDADMDEQQANPVTPINAQQYRNLFSTIFTDFLLFDKLYGVEGKVNPNVVNQVLVNMELPMEKVNFLKDQFTNLHLSSGQKKRLALTTALMEDKPIYIFDEVAADLDPDFRDKYYYELLNELKDRGKTVIVVSHDKHYWTVPDRLLEMNNGQIREMSKAEIDSLLVLNN